MKRSFKVALSKMLAFTMLFSTLGNVSIANAEALDSAVIDALDEAIVTEEALDAEVSEEEEVAVEESTPIVAQGLSEENPEYGKTYTYDFCGDDYASADYSSLIYSADGFVEYSGKYNGQSHGLQLGNGSYIAVKVAGDADLTFAGCQYTNAAPVSVTVSGSAVEATEIAGDVIKTTHCWHNREKAAEGETFSWTYNYEGDAATLVFTASGALYIPNLTVENKPEKEKVVIADKVNIDVWDFNGEQLANTDVINYNNHVSLTDLANMAGAPSYSSPKGTVQDFGGGLTYLGDIRLYNNSENSYDFKDGAVPDHTHTCDETGESFGGFLYANGTTNTSKGNKRYFTLENVSIGDKIEFYYAPANSTIEGAINFNYIGEYGTQTESIPVVTEYVSNLYGPCYRAEFIATCNGSYEFWASGIKAEYTRVVRTPKTFFEVSGNISVPADIPEGYNLTFTNQTNGEVRYAEISGSTYTAALPYGYVYDIAVEGGNGFVVCNPSPSTVDVNGTLNLDVEVIQIPLVTVSGTITGLGAAELAAAEITVEPSRSRVYAPTIKIDGTDVTMVVEPNIVYNVSAAGINDYEITAGESFETYYGETNYNLNFALKSTYSIAPKVAGLTDEQLALLTLTFTNIDEPEYSYTYKRSAEGKWVMDSYLTGWTKTDSIALRNGTYAVTYGGLDDYALDPGLIPNLVVDGAAANLILSFAAVDTWNFMVDFTAEDAAAGKFNGITLTSAKKDGNKYLTGDAGTVLEVPVEPGKGIVVDYTYQADFTANGINVTTATKSTNTVESAGFVADETGIIKIEMNAKTYLRQIRVVDACAYTETITVGADKMYQTINDALDAVYTMVRPNNERVTILVDPGNYEEMVRFSAPNVTLKNAAANPSIELTNKGVDIDPNAVRITSYYGCGYNYYSMNNNNVWDAETLENNTKNGSISTVNQGGGSATMWNATVIVTASGFEADGIIFENSFNQYISAKEAADTVVLTSSGKGERDHYEAGDVIVQNKSFVERAAAMAILNDKIQFTNCKFVGRQDTLYGQYDFRVYFRECEIYGGTDYIFGGMVATFDKCRLVANTSDDDLDYCYHTAAQQKEGRGYLFWNCTISSTTPGVDTASEYRAKQHFLGRPWQANTSEAIFYNTTIETTNRKVTDHSTSSVKVETVDTPVSLIYPTGWLNTLGGVSAGMMEYGTKELSGEDNSASRVEWCTMLTEPVLADGTEISRYLFTSGNDGWDPAAAYADEDIDNDCLLGDVDENGTITAADAADALQYTLDPERFGDEFHIDCTDVDGNGTITAADAAAILKKALNTEYKFPIEGEGDDPVEEKITVYVVGDSTGCDYINTDNTYYYKRVGFGTRLEEYFDNVEVVNLALSGRSSLSFLSEANYQTLISNIKEGDYLVIAFGHNDEKAEDPTRFTDASIDDITNTAGFKGNLNVNYIQKALEVGATPILCTPTVRRTTTDGTWSDNNVHNLTSKGYGDYAQAVRDLGAAANVAVIDNTALTKALYDELTTVNTKELHAWTSSKDTSVDNTHLNNYGAAYVAYMMASEIAKMDNTLAACVKAGIAAPDKEANLIVNPDYKEKVQIDISKSTIWTTTDPWWATVCGDAGGQGKIDGTETCAAADGALYYAVTEESAGNVTLRSGLPAGSLGENYPAADQSVGKISSTNDGVAFYFQKIDAASNFEITADAEVVSIGAPNNQISFGLMLSQNVAMDIHEAGPISQKYFAAGILGMAKAADGGMSYAFGREDGVQKTYITAPAGSVAPVAGDKFKFGIKKAGGSVTVTVNGQTYTQEATFENDVYVGAFTARCAQVKFTNININNEVVE